MTFIRSTTRVLHVAHGRIFGGIETLLVTLARFRHLCPSMAPAFGVCYEGRLVDELRRTGAPVHVLGEARASRPLSIRRARADLRRLLASGAFDVVVCHAAWPQAVFAPVAGAVGIPVVFWQHDRLSGRHWTERWARRSPPDHTVSNSAFSAETLRALYPQSPVDIMYYPVPPDAPDETAPARAEVRTSVREALATPPDATVIIQVSRMQPWKGHLNLVRALGAMRARPGWVAWIVGAAQRPEDEAYERAVRDEAASNGVVDRIRFCGQRADVPRLLRAADVFCQPNAGAEPFGIVYVEALYAGLPVVTTDMGGAREIVDDGCGVRTPPGDVDALAAALTRLVDDDAMRARLGAAGPARAAHLCNPVRQLARLAGLFTSIAMPAVRSAAFG
ncbi:hypothetical protein tb265_15670 [Gemmatimonadetes bacterium T265]|nr:hypothetical protein tb265_15670 [Gemmatimonadetes bacterium T265]